MMPTRAEEAVEAEPKAQLPSHSESSDPSDLESDPDADEVYVDQRRTALAQAIAVCRVFFLWWGLVLFSLTPSFFLYRSQANLGRQERYAGDRPRFAALQAELETLRQKERQLEHHEAKTNEWSSNYGHWTAVIESAETNPVDGHNSPVFVISVVNSAKPDEGWIVTRKETDFLLLHKQLHEVCTRFGASVQMLRRLSVDPLAFFAPVFVQVTCQAAGPALVYMDATSPSAHLFGCGKH